MAWPLWLLLAVTAILLLYPLWWRTQAPLPVGADSELVEEKRRLLGNLRRLRRDYSEGRVAAGDFSSLEAEAQQSLALVMDQLEQHAGDAAPVPVPPRPWLHRLGALILLLLLTGSTLALFNRLRPPEPGMSEEASLDAAVAVLEKKLAADPQNADSWALAARSYDALGKPAQAFQAWSKVLALQPDNREALFNLAVVLVAHEDKTSLETALGYLDRLAIKEPDAPELLWYRGVALAGLERKVEARKAWLRLLPMLPKESENARLVQEALKKTGP